MIQYHKVQKVYLVVSEFFRGVVRVDHGRLERRCVEVEDLVVVIVALVDQRDDGEVLRVGPRYRLPAGEGGEAGLLGDCGGFFLDGVAWVDHLQVLHRVREQGDHCPWGGWGWGQGWGWSGCLEAG